MGIEEILLDQAEKKGMKLARIQKDIAFTKGLLTSTDHTTLKIAQLVGVSEDFVLKVKKGIKNYNKEYKSKPVNLAAKYSGGMSKQPIEEINKQLDDLRNEWD